MEKGRENTKRLWIYFGVFMIVLGGLYFVTSAFRKWTDTIDIFGINSFVLYMGILVVIGVGMIIYGAMAHPSAQKAT